MPIQFINTLFLMNKADHPLPKKFELGERDMLLYRQYQRRATASPDNQKNPNPLSIDERMQLQAWRRDEEDSFEVMWDNQTFPFAPHGKQGSVYEVPEEVARALAQKHPRTLQLVADESLLPAGIKPIRPGAMGRPKPVVASMSAGGPGVRADDILAAGVAAQRRSA